MTLHKEPKSLTGAASTAPIQIGRRELIADAAGALLLESESLLVVADLHLEKGSFYASRNTFLPPWDTAATLARLAALLGQWRPRTVLALGDSFHDPRGSERMSAQDRDRLKSLQRGRNWIWVAGNHDPSPPRSVEGDFTVEVRLGALTFRHEPRAGAVPGEIAGHLHPVARVVSRSGSVRRRCFLSDGRRCLLPAFGAYAGGLNIRDAAYDPLFVEGPRTAHVLGRTRVYAVSEHSCAGE